MLKVLVVFLLSGLADRMRGGWPSSALWRPNPKPKWVNWLRETAKFSYGGLLALLVTTVWWQVLLCGVLWKFGEQLAGDFGGMFRIYRGNHSGWFHIIRVGTIWPLAPALVLFFATGAQHWITLIPAAVLGSVAGLFMSWAISLPRTQIFELRSAPAWGEFLRGAYIALFFAGFNGYGGLVYG